MTLIERIKLLWRLSSAIPAIGADIEGVGESPEEQAELAYRVGALDQHQLNRLKSLWKFTKLAGKAKEIDEQWQRIQQDEHDAFFAYQISKGHSEADYAYKRGVTDGIKWCVKHFS